MRHTTKHRNRRMKLQKIEKKLKREKKLAKKQRKLATQRGSSSRAP